jgi:hypothetical protein
MPLRDLARKGLGLFVELPPESPAPIAGPAPPAGGSDLRTRSLGELLQDLGTPAEPAKFDAPPPAAVTDGKVDFGAIYRAAGIEPLAFTAEQTLELIQSLPAELPLETKRQTVAASLNTMGKAMNVGKEQVVLDAHRKLDALAAFEESSKAQRDTAAAASEEKIRQLQAEIEAERQRAAAADAQYQQLKAQCEAQGSLLDQVQEFLTLDAGASVHARELRPAEGPRPPGT